MVLKEKIVIDDAVRVISYYSDFNGDVGAWKLAFYELWRYQMTWSFAYEIAVNESRKNGIYVDLLVKPGYRDSIIETMDSIGYGKIATYADHVGIIEEPSDKMIDTGALLVVVD